jgi:hypothetical protein
MTANDIIAAAMRRLGALTQGETPTAAESADALATLNDMLEAWSIDRLTVFTLASAQYTLTGGKQTYTIGIDPAGVLTADFNAVRPARVSDARLIVSGMRYGLEIVEDKRWAERPLQSFIAIPSKLYVDGGYPLQTLALDPAPSDAYTLELWSWQALQQFANLAAKYYFPPAYARALKHNLAVELAPSFDREPSPTLVRLAAESKAAVENLNLESPVADVDPAVLGGRNGRVYMGWIGNYR